jgi:hypothetical protein
MEKEKIEIVTPEPQKNEPRVFNVIPREAPKQEPKVFKIIEREQPKQEPKVFKIIQNRQTEPPREPLQSRLFYVNEHEKTLLDIRKILETQTDEEIKRVYEELKERYKITDNE